MLHGAMGGRCGVGYRQRAFAIEHHAATGYILRGGLRQVVDVAVVEAFGQTAGAVAVDFHARGVAEAPLAQLLVGEAVHAALRHRHLDPIARGQTARGGVEVGRERMQGGYARQQGNDREE